MEQPPPPLLMSYLCRIVFRSLISKEHVVFCVHLFCSNLKWFLSVSYVLQGLCRMITTMWQLRGTHIWLRHPLPTSLVTPYLSGLPWREVIYFSLTFWFLCFRVSFFASVVFSMSICLVLFVYIYVFNSFQVFFVCMYFSDVICLIAPSGSLAFST